MQEMSGTTNQPASGGSHTEQFLAILSHELRSPLASLSNAVNVLRREHNAVEQGRMLDIVERQTRQMRQLIDELFEFSRIANGRIVLHLQHIDLRGVVEQALETARPLIERHSHQLTVSLPPTPVWVNADATRLSQILVNLLDNAAKYTDEKGQLYLSVDQAAGRIAVRVRDTGVGIDAQALPHIFELFAQSQRSAAHAEGGFGIGLALVRKLVELHGGTVSCTSGGPGQGSEFTVDLPAAAGAELSQAHRMREAADTQAHS